MFGDSEWFGDSWHNFNFDEQFSNGLVQLSQELYIYIIYPFFSLPKNLQEGEYHKMYFCWMPEWEQTADRALALALSDPIRVRSMTRTGPLVGVFTCSHGLGPLIWLSFQDLYFHCTAVNKACPFDELRVNDEVNYEAGGGFPHFSLVSANGHCIFNACPGLHSRSLTLREKTPHLQERCVFPTVSVFFFLRAVETSEMFLCRESPDVKKHTSCFRQFGMKERITLQRDLIAPASFSIKKAGKKGWLVFSTKRYPPKKMALLFCVQEKCNTEEWWKWWRRC